MKQVKLNEKSKQKREESKNLENLLAFLLANNISEDEAIERLQVQMFDPAKDFYASLVLAAKELIKGVRDKTLNLNLFYDEGLFKLLQSGDKISKSLKMAKLEAYPEEDREEEEEGGALDRLT